MLKKVKTFLYPERRPWLMEASSFQNHGSIGPRTPLPCFDVCLIPLLWQSVTDHHQRSAAPVRTKQIDSTRSSSRSGSRPMPAQKPVGDSEQKTSSLPGACCRISAICSGDSPWWLIAPPSRPLPISIGHREPCATSIFLHLLDVAPRKGKDVGLESDP